MKKANLASEWDFSDLFNFQIYLLFRWRPTDSYLGLLSQEFHYVKQQVKQLIRITSRGVQLMREGLNCDKNDVLSLKSCHFRRSYNDFNFPTESF